MPYVRGHWRGDRWVDPHSRRTSKSRGGDFSENSKRRILARLIEKGMPKEKASSEYQAIWEDTIKWIQDGKSDGTESLPPGGKWITECLYEVD